MILCLASVVNFPYEDSWVCVSLREELSTRFSFLLAYFINNFNSELPTIDSIEFALIKTQFFHEYGVINCIHIDFSLDQS